MPIERELTVDPGDQQDEMAALTGGFDGGVLLLGNADGDGHVREDHHVVEGENGQELRSLVRSWLPHTPVRPVLRIH